MPCELAGERCASAWSPAVLYLTNLFGFDVDGFIIRWCAIPNGTTFFLSEAPYSGDVGAVAVGVEGKTTRNALRDPYYGVYGGVGYKFDDYKTRLGEIIMIHVQCSHGHSFGCAPSCR